MQQNKNGLQKRLKSFTYAFSGIIGLIKSEPNARIHLIATIFAIIAGVIFNISPLEWCIIILVIAFVWAAEGFNTVFEKLSDHLFPEYNETAKKIKDISAGAVLICAIAALITGLIIFLPKLFSYIYL